MCRGPEYLHSWSNVIFVTKASQFKKKMYEEASLAFSTAIEIVEELESILKKDPELLVNMYHVKAALLCNFARNCNSKKDPKKMVIEYFEKGIQTCSNAQGVLLDHQTKDVSATQEKLSGLKNKMDTEKQKIEEDLKRESELKATKRGLRRYYLKLRRVFL